jgi:hypothetical protein
VVALLMLEGDKGGEREDHLPLLVALELGLKPAHPSMPQQPLEPPPSALLSYPISPYCRWPLLCT